MVYLMCFVAGHGGNLGWFPVAAALAVCVFAFHTTSNAFFNPARAIGGAVFTFGYVWTNFWIYIIGPLIGYVTCHCARITVCVTSSVMSILVFGLVFQTKADNSKGENLFRGH
jgi:glycerol uptake facilitator-like aquaporin